ncbi:MAG TPA: hypothetical protein VKU38_11615 [Ktedonobacteraceae bacterium]|nr:hypothetical protein [Ktedonobacteraceae bacterium]
MAPFMTLIFLLFMAMVGFVFDLYLFSRGAFGNRYVRNTKFTRPVSTGPWMNDKDEYELYVCSDAMYDNERSQRTHTVLVILCAAIVIIGMILFMLINTFA